MHTSCCSSGALYYICIHAYIPHVMLQGCFHVLHATIHTYTYIKRYMNTYRQTYIHTCIHTYIHTCMLNPGCASGVLLCPSRHHTYISIIKTYMNTYRQTYIHTCIHTCIHTYMYTYPMACFWGALMSFTPYIHFYTYTI